MVAVERLEKVRAIVDEILRHQPDADNSRCGFVHLYGVSTACIILALKRGLDPHLCATAGMLHDISSYRTGDPTDHARHSAVEAETILRETGLYAEDEIAALCDAIRHHSLKGQVNGEMAECLKDADVFQHYLYSPTPNSIPQGRLKSVLEELGLGVWPQSPPPSLLSLRGGGD